MPDSKQLVTIDPVAVLSKTAEQRNGLHDQLAMAGAYIDVLTAENDALKAEIEELKKLAEQTGEA